ncbi:MAG: hypothetical protein OEN50_12490, partial [Deltaproteobacteria bacterium]|nr:hypothetical protein [Deltaproteobacteria bacterium]
MEDGPRQFPRATGVIDHIQARFRNLRVPFEGRTERFIAIGRVVLASFSLLAIWLDPASPAKYANLSYFLLSAYLTYALGIAFFVLTSSAPLVRLPLVSHILDLAIISVLLFFTEGVASPFFVYFVFALVCATMRWQWRGALWTAVTIMVVFLGIGLYGAKVLQDPNFELNRFLIRSIYLGVVAV